MFVLIISFHFRLMLFRVTLQATLWWYFNPINSTVSLWLKLVRDDNHLIFVFNFIYWLNNLFTVFLFNAICHVGRKWLEFGRASYWDLTLGLFPNSRVNPSTTLNLIKRIDETYPTCRHSVTSHRSQRIHSIANTLIMLRYFNRSRNIQCVENPFLTGVYKKSVM